MTGLEVAATATAKAVAQKAAREWLSARAAAGDRDKDLTELIKLSFPDRFLRRSLDRQIGEIADTVEKRLGPLLEQEYGGLADNDRTAVLLEVRDALAGVRPTDELIFAADADPVRLARSVRALLPASPLLGEAAARLYDVLLEECCDCLVRIVVGLPQFAGRASAETLARLSGLGEQVSLVLARLPVRTLDAPEGVAGDAEFERRYREHLAGLLDEIELFGVWMENYRPRATLSVAYISLTVSAEDRRDEPGLLKNAALTGRERPEPSAMPAEAMLARSARTLLRGQAGSGKSTLLRWIAVTAARRGFTGALADWNGRVPFLIKLRSHPDGPLPGPAEFVAGPLAGLAPDAWAHRVLSDGRGILLVDGVDEVPYGRRDAVRQWLRALLDVYPKLCTVVTSRPAAADMRWLSAEGFGPVMLEPMTPDNLHALVRQWHAAVRHAGSLPCAPEELPAYEGRLLARLESAPHLRGLAATPLLATMLCALHLDQVELPRDRMGLYRAVLDLLLEKRDLARGIQGSLTLERGQKERLLQELAWALTTRGGAEMSRTTAVRRIAARAEGMPRVTAPAADLLDHLLQRSGVIREPVPDRIDFVHRTVQEYLAAEQAADDADAEILIARAHLDQWRDTVVMAAGHGNAPFRASLLTGIIERADTEPRHARRLRLLVAACLETMPDVPRESRERVENCCARVIPPRNTAEARRLAGAGEEILRRLPETLDDLTDAQAIATVRTAWLINGPRSLDVLARYASDPRVQDELIEAWEYFEPHQYAERVLADAPLERGRLVVSNPALLPAVHALNHLDTLHVNLPYGTDPRCLPRIPAMKELNTTWSGSLSALAEYPWLEELWLTGRAANTSVLSELPALKSLRMPTSVTETNIDFVGHLPRLLSLGLGPLTDVSDFGPLTAQSRLSSLWLYNCGKLTSIGALPPLPDLTDLLLLGARLGPDGLDQISSTWPGLDDLRLAQSDWVRDLTPVVSLPLRFLALEYCPNVTDLGPVGRLRSLRYLSLDGTSVADLEPLTGCEKLRWLFLPEQTEPDLAPLRPMRDLEIFLGSHQPVRGLDRLHKSVRLRRI